MIFCFWHSFFCSILLHLSPFIYNRTYVLICQSFYGLTGLILPYMIRGKGNPYTGYFMPVWGKLERYKEDKMK
nr:MAG TPA: hypothetical protein [Caudoviricetes sp.]